VTREQHRSGDGAQLKMQRLDITGDFGSLDVLPLDCLPVPRLGFLAGDWEIALLGFQGGDRITFTTDDRKSPRWFFLPKKASETR
jgi:hypothetical protein